MMQAKWNGKIIAKSGNTVVVDGNHYFPVESVGQDILLHSATTTICGWKGTARYYSLAIDGKTNENAAWYYPEPKEAAAEIKDHVAFWKGVEVSEA